MLKQTNKGLLNDGGFGRWLPRPGFSINAFQLHRLEDLLGTVGDYRQLIVMGNCQLDWIDLLNVSIKGYFLTTGYEINGDNDDNGNDGIMMPR